jgi:uncharacterized protein
VAAAARTFSCVWRRLDTPGLEWARFDDTGIRGSVLVQLDGNPRFVTYAIRRDRHWHTRRATVEMEDWSGRRRLALRVDAAGRWFAGHRPLDWARGLLDVDLGVTPSTNTLPIRRLRLAVGDSAELIAVWVHFPSLEVRPLAQRYTRLGPSTYRYQSIVEGKVRFSARVSIDREGAVRRYAGLFQRLA